MAIPPGSSASDKNSRGDTRSSRPSSEEPVLTPGDLLRNPHVRRWGPAAVLVVIAAFFLLPVLNGVYIWDDSVWLLANQTVHSLSHLADIWLKPAASPHYYPLVFTTFALEWHLWGAGVVGGDGLLRGVGYHVDNLLLHIASALILFQLLKRLKLPSGEFGAWLAAVIYAIHPVNVESVAWVVERKNMLCGVFFFGSLFMGLKFFGVIDPPADGEPELGTRKQYAAALIFFLAAMFSKTVACVLPPLLLVMIWWRRGTIRWKEILWTIPFFLIAIGLGLVSISIEHGSVGTTGAEFAFSPLAKHLILHPDQATVPLKIEAFGQEFLARTLMAGNALWFYISKVLWPFPVMQVYPRWNIDIANPFWYIAPITFLAFLAALILLRKKLGRGPAAAILFFAIALFPALGYVTFYTMLFSLVADHYQYLACIAIIVLAIEMLLWVLRAASRVVPTSAADPAEGTARFLSLSSGLIAAGLLLSLGVLSYGVASLYGNPETLWLFNLSHNPGSFVVWNHLGDARLAITPPDDRGAIEAFQQSIRLNPGDWRAYHTIGQYYLDHGMPDVAAKFLDKSEALMPEFVKNNRAAFFEREARLTAAGSNEADTTQHSRHYLLGRGYEDHQQWDRAIAEFQAALKETPADPSVSYELGNCYIGKSDLPSAIPWYRKAIDLNPKYAEAWFNLGVTLRGLHKEEEGIQAILKARRLDEFVVRKVPGLLQQAAQDFRKQ